MSVKHLPDSELGTLLLHAHRSGTPATISSTLEPADLDAAYAIQLEVLTRRKQTVGGWKVGAKTPQAPIHGALLPSDCVMPDPAYLSRSTYPVMGIELEIAFTFSRAFAPRAEKYSDAEVIGSLCSMSAAIEIVSSRVAGWPEVPPLIQHADMQCHVALVVGEKINYDPDFPFLGVATDLRIDDQIIFGGNGANPAGDPRRLLPWVVNHCSAQGLKLTAGDVVTTGSYTGAHFPAAGGTLIGRIGALPPVRLMLL